MSGEVVLKKKTVTMDYDEYMEWNRKRIEYVELSGTAYKEGKIVKIIINTWGRDIVSIHTRDEIINYAIKSLSIIGFIKLRAKLKEKK